MSAQRPAPWEEPKKDEALTGSPRAKPRCKIHPVNESTGFCTSCGAPFCPACKTNALGRHVCTTCFESTKELEKRHEEEKKRLKHQVRQKVLRAKWVMRGPLGTAIRLIGTVKEKGGLPLKRMVAQLLNLPIVLGFGVLVWILADQIFSGKPEWRQIWIWYGQPFGLLWGSLLYFFPAWGVFGTDIGKLTLGLEIKSSKGKRLGLWRAFWRWVGMIAMLIWLTWGILILGWTSWVLNMAGKMASSKITLVLWGFSGFISFLVWLLLLLMFLGRQHRHFADILGQCKVQAKIPREESSPPNSGSAIP